MVEITVKKKDGTTSTFKDVTIDPTSKLFFAEPADPVPVPGPTPTPTPTPSPTPGTGKDGVKQIYPSVTTGNKDWFLERDPASDPRCAQWPAWNATTKIVNVKNLAARLNIYAENKSNYSTTPSTYARDTLYNQGYMYKPTDWTNWETTAYFKINKSNDTSDQITVYGGGGKHNDNNGGCEGSSYKADVYINGGTRFAKETWHVNYDFTAKKNTLNLPNIVGKWIGIKHIKYNIKGTKFPKAAKNELWVDLQGGDDITKQNWQKADEFTDDGFGGGATHCGGNPADNIPICWGGPITTLRFDQQADVDVKLASCREIQPPAA